MLLNAENYLSIKEKKESNKLAAAPKSQNNYLWIDKYSPQKYIDLISDPENNRYVTQWLKQWSPIIYHTVFNSYFL